MRRWRRCGDTAIGIARMSRKRLTPGWRFGLSRRVARRPCRMRSFLSPYLGIDLAGLLAQPRLLRALCRLREGHADKASASFKNGVLELTLPRHKKAKRRKVEDNSSAFLRL